MRLAPYPPNVPGCAFCEVVAGGTGHEIYRDETMLAFLDRAPLIHGHTLVVPIQHVETLDDLPAALMAPFVSVVQRVSRAFPAALGAEGSFVGINTRISQSVPHLHAHVVPRRKGDGLFSTRMLWQRRPYAEGEAEAVAGKLRAAVAEPRHENEAPAHRGPRPR